MSFSGDLEEIPVVDVVQLLHGTRKCGILNIEGRKGKSQLVFKDGFIVSASHLNNSVRIGEFMVERGDITAEALGQALNEQRQAKNGRQPLIVTLISLGLVEEQKAYAALQALISMTIVEVMTWKVGSFLLEPSREVTKDNFKYYPDHLDREINIDVQGALLDALRVYDEKARDGELADENEVNADELDDIAAELLGMSDELVEPEKNESEQKSDGVVTVDDLGLDELDKL